MLGGDGRDKEDALRLTDRNGNQVDAWGSCGRKRSYPSKRLAARKAKALGLTPYRCGICGMWHLTSMTRDDVHRMRGQL